MADVIKVTIKQDIYPECLNCNVPEAPLQEGLNTISELELTEARIEVDCDSEHAIGSSVLPEVRVQGNKGNTSVTSSSTTSLKHCPGTPKK